MNSLDVIELIFGSKNFATLYNGAPIAERIDQKEGQPSTIFLCTLQRPCNIPSLVPTALTSLNCSSLKDP